MNDLTVQLECGAFLECSTTPFSLPSVNDRSLLMNPELPQRFAKQIAYDLENEKLTGIRLHNQMPSLKKMFEQSLQSVTIWLKSILTNYVSHLQPLHILYHPFEEALRILPMDQREDLLHLVSLESSLSRGKRLLSIQVNLHPENDRILITSEPLRTLIEHHGDRARLWEAGSANWAKRAIQSLPRLLRRSQQQNQIESLHRRFVTFMRGDERIQERSPRQVRRMPRDSVWMFMPDGLSHAVLRGQHVLEHIFCVDAAGLRCPEQSPTSLLTPYLRGTSGNRAA